MKTILIALILSISSYSIAQTSSYQDGYVMKKTYDEESILVNSSNYGSDASIKINDDVYTISFNGENGRETYKLTNIKGMKYRNSNKVIYTIEDDMESNGILRLSDDKFVNNQTSTIYFYGLKAKK